MLMDLKFACKCPVAGLPTPDFVSGTVWLGITLVLYYIGIKVVLLI